MGFVCNVPHGPCHAGAYPHRYMLGSGTVPDQASFGPFRQKFLSPIPPTEVGMARTLPCVWDAVMCQVCPPPLEKPTSRGGKGSSVRGQWWRMGRGGDQRPPQDNQHPSLTSGSALPSVRGFSAHHGSCPNELSQGHPSACPNSLDSSSSANYGTHQHKKA